MRVFFLQTNLKQCITMLFICQRFYASPKNKVLQKQIWTSRWYLFLSYKTGYNCCSCFPSIATYFSFYPSLIKITAWRWHFLLESYIYAKWSVTNEFYNLKTYQLSGSKQWLLQNWLLKRYLTAHAAANTLSPSWNLIY